MKLRSIKVAQTKTKNKLLLLNNELTRMIKYNMCISSLLNICAFQNYFMRNLFTVILSFISFQSFAAEDSIQTNAKLSHVSVYHTMGAEIQHQAKVSLKKGIQYVVIDNLSQRLDESSFRLGCPENVTILSYQFMLYQKPIVIPDNPKHADSVKTLQRSLASVQNEIVITDEQLRKVAALIENNFTTTDKKNIVSAEVIRLTEYYIQKIKELKSASYSLNVRYQDLSTQLTNLVNNPGIQPPKPNPATGRLVLQVIAETAGIADLSVFYYTQYAGWLPTYDMRLTTIDQAFTLNYKASVTQQTGLDWEGIPLTLSTQPPSTGGNLPTLHTIFLQMYVPELYSVMQRSSGQNLPALKKDNAEEKVTLADANVPPNVEAYTNLTDNMLNVSYNINLPYNIPSNGKAYTINIKDEKVIALYRHLGIPKLDPDVYFTANLYDWASLNLLPGGANIIIDNIYMGKSFISTNTNVDTLQLSLGKDKRVVQTRTLVKDLTTFSKRNGAQTNTYTYEITVRNNKNKSVEITVKDQFPIAKEKEIEIKLLSSDDAEVNAETGILTWKHTLKPGEVKKVRFSYQVKVPEGKKTRETRG